MTSIRVLAAAAVLAAAVGGLVVAGEPRPDPVGALALSSATPSPVLATGTPSASPTVEPSNTASAATPTPSVIRPTPVRTPFPDTPTPALPEEGGPPGGVLGGHLYIDDNGDGVREDGEGVAPGVVFVRGLDVVDGGHSRVGVSSDTSGRWQLRGLADGAYQVYSEPQIPADLFDKTSPPVQTIVLNPNSTIRAIATTVKVSGANRISDIDFGIPPQRPVAGAKVTLPRTGEAANSGGSLAMWLLVAGVALSVATVGVLAVRRR